MFGFRESNVTTRLVGKMPKHPNSIVLITSNNIKLIEFHACRYIISRNLILFPLSIFLYIPYISNFFGNKLYKYIARNRKCKNLNF